MGKRLASYELTLLAIGNLIAYIPLAMMTKMSSKALFASQNGVPAAGFEILPLFAVGNAIVLFLFFTISGWWGYAERTTLLGLSIPRPRWYTVVWGLSTIAQIVTVLWIYSFQGISIVFASLIMKGGVLILAPIVDLVVRSRKRKIYWPSWIAAGLSLFALVVSFMEKANVAINLACIADIAIYLIAFFFKLTTMSKWAKTQSVMEKKQWIVEGQITVGIGLLVLVGVMGFIGRFMEGSGPFVQVWRGIFVLPATAFIDVPMVIGVVAAIGGFMASMIFLDRRENTFCVTMVQSTSIIAGTIATTLLALFYDQPEPGVNRLFGVCVILVAIFFLAYRGVVEKRKIGKDAVIE